MGYPAGASGPDKPGLGFNWQAMAATGNAFAVPVLAHLLGGYASWVDGGSKPPTHAGTPALLDPEAILRALLPSGGQGRRG